MHANLLIEEFYPMGFEISTTLDKSHQIRCIAIDEFCSLNGCYAECKRNTCTIFQPLKPYRFIHVVRVASKTQLAAVVPTSIFHYIFIAQGKTDNELSVTLYSLHPYGQFQHPTTT